MKGSYLVIPNVNLDLLEAQRQALNDMPHETYLELPETVRESINGILHMLDKWSDERMEAAVEDFCSELIPQFGEWPEAFVWQGCSYDKQTYQGWLSSAMKDHWDTHIQIQNPTNVEGIDDAGN